MKNYFINKQKMLNSCVLYDNKRNQYLCMTVKGLDFVDINEVMADKASFFCVEDDNNDLAQIIQSAFINDGLISEIGNFEVMKIKDAFKKHKHLIEGN